MNPDTKELMTFSGWFVRGFATGRGMIIVRPAYVAFLPTQAIKHLGTELLKGVTFAAAGVVEIGKDRRIRLDDWAQNLSKLSDSELDAEVSDVVGKIGGIVWRKGEAKVVYKSILLRRKKGLWFVAGKESIRVAKPLLDSEKLATAQRILAGWET
jgi:hypothetical protein